VNGERAGIDSLRLPPPLRRSMHLRRPSPSATHHGRFAHVRPSGPPPTSKWLVTVSAESRSSLDALVKASAERYISSAEIAAVYAALGDTSSSLQWLNKAVNERASALVYLNVDPIFDHMRGDPRFQVIVRRVNLITRKNSLPGWTMRWHWKPSRNTKFTFCVRIKERFSSLK